MMAIVLSRESSLSTFVQAFEVNVLHIMFKF